jgi:hypothetical protein
MGIFGSKTITFQAFGEYVEAADLPPSSASKHLPEWYKKLPRYVNNSDRPIKALGKKDLKICVPFRDAMISGYMILLQADIEVCISASGDVDIFSNRDLPFMVVEKRGATTQENQGFGMPNPIGTVPTLFTWAAVFGVGTDKTDSILVTHPLNRHDLPFVTTSGIIDSGYHDKAGNIPFFIKEGFTGIIPKGTPIAQILPFKRQDWESKIIPYDIKSYLKFLTLKNTYIGDFYSKFMRQPKSYK